MKPQKKPQADALPFHLQDALDKIKPPKQRMRIHWQVVLGIILVHAVLLFLLQDEMMVRARKMFKSEIVYVTIIPPAVSTSALPPAPVKPPIKSSSPALPSTAPAPASTATNTPASSKASIPSSEVAGNKP